ncbi:MAG: GntR family transcriptional regulator [Desulfocucumaceae bacterium]
MIIKYSGHFVTPPNPVQNNGMYSSVQEQVYKKLQDSILSGVLEPDQRLLPDELAAGMGVERVHMREALLRLEAESLVIFHAYKGFTVASFTLDDLKEIYFLRSLLEGEAAVLAAKNLTDADLDQLEGYCRKMEESLERDEVNEMPPVNTCFHEAIYYGAKSPRLYKMVVRLWNGFPKSSIGFLTLRAPIMVREHRAIYEALRRRSPEEARAKVQEHVASALNDLLEYWGERLTSSK